MRSLMKSSTCSVHVVHPTERSDASIIVVPQVGGMTRIME